MSLQVINNGSFEGDNSAETIYQSFEKTKDNFAELFGSTGWGQYTDTQYTSGSPFSVTADEVNYTDLPNNAGNLLETQKPLDITTFYDPITKKILGRNGDGINIAIEFDATPSANNAWIQLAVDIGSGTPILLYPDTISFPRGSGVSRRIIYKLNSAYTLDTWEANGGTVKFISNVNLTIHSIRYIITRTHKAR